MSNYSSMLRDPRWQKKRLEIMERDGFACVECKDKESTLNVHHTIYLTGKKPWEYEPYHLVTLCESCHEKTEDILRNIRGELSRMRLVDLRNTQQILNSDVIIVGELLRVLAAIPNGESLCDCLRNLVGE